MASKMGAYKYEGCYCNHCGPIIQKELKNLGRQGLIVEYVGIVFKAILSTFWDILKLMGRAALDALGIK